MRKIREEEKWKQSAEIGTRVRKLCRGLLSFVDSRWHLPKYLVVMILLDFYEFVSGRLDISLFHTQHTYITHTKYTKNTCTCRHT